MARDCMHPSGFAVAERMIGLDGEDVVGADMRDNVKLRNIRRDSRVALRFVPPPIPGV